MNVRSMFFTKCKFLFCMWFLLCRCCKWGCCLCSHVYPHKYNSIVIIIPIVYGFFLSIVITIPFVDGFFFYFSTSKFPSYFSQIIVDLNIQSINSIVLVTRLSSVLDHYLFSIFLSHSLSLCPQRGLISSFTPDLMFLNSTDSHMANTKQVRYQVWQAMMPVPIVFLLIRSYLVNWPFYVSVFCVNE